MTSPCPSPQVLQDFDLGRLSPEAIEQLGDHLSQCTSCLALLDTLDDAADPLLTGLRPPELPLAAGDEQLHGLLQRAATIPRLAAAPTITHWDAAAPPVANLPVGVPLQLGQYKLLGQLGQGGMGTVYKALHGRLEKLVALKVLAPERLHDLQAIARFEREMRAVGKLRHARIVAAHDAGESEGAHFLVMELIDGRDLSALLHKHGPLRIADACEIARQTAEGLQAIHEHGLVHRDIKPSNLMLTRDGDVKILDLGLALLQSPSTTRHVPDGDNSQPLRLLGTADFLAPEQARDSRSIDIRADLYSLGCTLVKLLTGEPPYPAPRWPTTEQKVQAHCTAPLPDLRQRSDLPRELVQVIERLLAKSPDDRYGLPAKAAAALVPFARGSNLRGLLEDSPNVQAAAPATRRTGMKTRLIALAVFALTLLGVAAWYLTGQGNVTLSLPDPTIEITVDGRAVASDIRFLPERVERSFRIPAGHHELRATRAGFQPFITTFWLLRNRDVLFDATFIRDPHGAPASEPPSPANSGEPIATTDAACAWDLSIRRAAGKNRSIYYVPLKADWAGAKPAGMVQDAIFWGPFAADQPDSIWIFRTRVYAEAAMKVDIFWGHDDGGALYLNDKLVASSATTSGRFGHLAYTGQLEFQPGWNTVEMAVYVAEGASSINLGAIAPRHHHALSQVPGLTLQANAVR